MLILHGLGNLPDPRLSCSCVTWGVFDGVHRGHKKVLLMLRDWAKAAPSVVITFEQHPAEVLYGREVPLVVPLEERTRLIGERGVTACLVLPFTREFAQTKAEQFVRDIVVGKLTARGILLGHDSHFGRDRKGDFDLLEKLGREIGVEVRTCEPEMFGGRPISSSLIREAIASGRMEDAAALLGRAVSIRGRVVRGERRGATLGFPTANITIGPKVRPPRGVYAVEVAWAGRSYRAVANLGRRPTFHGEEAPEVLEVHLLDFKGGDLEGQELEVRFLSKLRDERKFSGAEELKKQIQSDIERASEIRP